MIFNLKASLRYTQKKSDLTALRSQGLIPAVVYGPGMEAKSISVSKAEFGQCFKKSFGELAFYEIDVDGTSYHTLLKEKQSHPVTREFLHLDFMVIPAQSAIEIDVPIKFIGEAAGAKEGGLVDIITRHVKISCKADVIPEDIPIDISGLHVGGSLHVSDLPKGNWQYKDHLENTLVVVHAKKVDSAAATPQPAKEN